MKLIGKSQKLSSRQSTKPSKLEPITLRGFSGGWNTVDDDESMAPRFLVTAKNFRMTASGAQRLRHGNSWFADVADTVDGDIIDSEYFNRRIIVVTDAGQVASINDSGTKVALWNSAIAGALPGAPSGWSTGLTTIDFVPFKNQLIIHNGEDKPITISSLFATTYLQDLASGSNVNVPIGKYGCVVSNYHCVAGIPAAPTTVYISAIGTAGTFPSDPPPNDSISIDVGAYAPEGAAEIRGIAGYRTNLIVFFQEQALVVKLGVYDDDGVHRPEFPDTLPKFGLLGHRCTQHVATDLLFGGFSGVSSAKKNVFAPDNLDSDQLSAYIEPRYRRVVGSVDMDDLLVQSFMIHDPLANETMLFPEPGKAFVYAASEKLRYRGWSYFETPPWTSACQSALGRVFFTLGTRVYQHGNAVFDNESYHADYQNDRDEAWGNSQIYGQDAIVWDSVDEVSYLARHTHESAASGTFAQDRANNPTFWEEYLGELIDFDMELPWLKGRSVMQLKHNKFVSVATKGTAEFTLKIYTNHLYKDAEGNEIYDPAVSITLTGNLAPGFGEDAGPYGGGLRSADPRLIGLPFKFKAMKPRITGSTRKPLEIIDMSFLFARGKFNV